jgi:secreted trypsin-like serine protease
VCGKRKPTAKIIGGTETGINEYPWQAGLLMKSVGVKPVCGGTIMNTQWVMTAAHCMKAM